MSGTSNVDICRSGHRSVNCSYCYSGYYIYLQLQWHSLVAVLLVVVVVVVQGDPKKMHHKDSDLKSVLEVRFYFSTCVLESEF